MAAPFLLLLLLLASGVAVGGNDGYGLPHLELHGIQDSGRRHASDAPPQAQGLVDYLQSTHSCERFAALVAATDHASDFFRIFAGTNGELTVFCPDDVAMAAFEANFNSLGAADKLAVLLLHTAAARYGREQLAAFDSVTVRMIDVDPATSKNRVLTVRDNGETVRLFLWLFLWPARGSGGAATTARVTKDLSSGYFAVYVVDTVLLPDHLRQRLDGGDEEAAACTPRGGVLGWLHHTVPMWAALCMIGAAFMGSLTGLFLSRRHDAAMN